MTCNVMLFPELRLERAKEVKVESPESGREEREREGERESLTGRGM